MWIMVAGLLALAALIFALPQRAAKVELVSFPDSPPDWVGAYPHFISTLDQSSKPPRSTTPNSLVKPTIRHESPVNQFEVDLHTGRFILRRTDLFVPDVIPLALTRTYVVWDYHSRAFGVGGNHPYDIA